jgi:hypothetical protein
MKLVKLAYAFWRNILGLVAVIALFMVITGIHPHTHVVEGHNPAAPISTKQTEWDACHRLFVDSKSRCWLEYKNEHNARIRRINK